MSNNFDSFAALPETLQLEALREGEARMLAQLQTATAADQRALTWGGLLVAAATGALGGGLALIGKEKPDYALGSLAVTFSLFMMVSAWAALHTVQPGLFCFPGNKPSNWLPENWACLGSDEQKILRARCDQAKQISEQIDDNAKSAALRAVSMARSFRLARYTLLSSAVLLMLVGVQRFFDIDWNGALRAIEHCFCD